MNERTLSEFTALIKVRFQRPEQTGKKEVQNELVVVLKKCALCCCKLQKASGVHSIYEWDTSTIVAAAIPTETDRDYVTKGNELL